MTKDRLFEKYKETIMEKVEDGLKRFEMGRQTCLATDFSRKGLGFFLPQQHCQCDLAKDPILGDKALDQIQNPRLRGMKEKTLLYKFTSVHVPGSLHFGPDATSRYPVREVSSCLVKALAWSEMDEGCAEEVGLVMAVKARGHNHHLGAGQGGGWVGQGLQGADGGHQGGPS